MSNYNLIQENASKIVKMYQAIDETYKAKAKNPKAWEDACARFHASFNALAFPGGLNEGMLLLKQGDSKTVDSAIDFLEVNPNFHRSGYIKEDILRKLGQVEFTPKQVQRLRKILSYRLEDGRGREVKSYHKLAKKIGLITE